MFSRPFPQYRKKRSCRDHSIFSQQRWRQSGDDFTSFDIFRFVLAALLLSAAVLKGHQQISNPFAGTGIFALHYFPLFLAALELFLGLWLLSGAYQHAVRKSVISCFFVFAVVSLYHALSGEQSCGCFGRLEISPWWTLSGDILIVGSMFFIRPVNKHQSHSDPVRFGGVVCLTLLFGISGGTVILQNQTIPVHLVDSPESDASFVVLEPKMWVGTAFPLLSEIDIGDQLAQGEWVILFFRNSCSECHTELQNMQATAQSLMGKQSGFQIALIEVPPFGHFNSSDLNSDHQVVSGRLNEERIWYVQTPVWINLREGSVTHVASRSETNMLQIDSVLDMHARKTSTCWHTFDACEPKLMCAARNQFPLSSIFGS